MNIANVATITGSTSAYSSVPTTGATIINSVPSSHVYKINSVLACNKTGTAAWVSLALYRNFTFYTLAYQMSVPANATLVVIGKDAPIYLMDTTSDSLSALAGTSSAIDIITSYEDLS